MQRLVVRLAAVLVGCLAIPASLQAQDATEYINRGDGWRIRGEYAKAIVNYGKAEKLLDSTDVDDAITLADLCCNRGNAYHCLGEYDLAIDDYNHALVFNPGYVLAYERRGLAWFEKGDYDKALADENQALAIDEKDINAYVNRGNISFKKGQYENARVDYQQAVDIITVNDEALKRAGQLTSAKPNPLLAEPCYGLGNVWAKAGELRSAVIDYDKSLRANPNYAEAYYARGRIGQEIAHYDLAIADYNQALAVNPKLTAAYNALGWLHATCPDEQYRDGSKAFENASKAYQLDGGKYWGYFETLAAAYAESGDFKKAKDNQAKAIELAAADKSATDKDKAEAKARLALYTQGKPYHQEPPKIEPPKIEPPKVEQPKTEPLTPQDSPQSPTP